MEGLNKKIGLHQGEFTYNRVTVDGRVIRVRASARFTVMVDRKYHLNTNPQIIDNIKSGKYDSKFCKVVCDTCCETIYINVVGVAKLKKDDYYDRAIGDKFARTKARRLAFKTLYRIYNDFQTEICQMLYDFTNAKEYIYDRVEKMGDKMAGKEVVENKRSYYKSKLLN